MFRLRRLQLSVSSCPGSTQEPVTVALADLVQYEVEYEFGGKQYEEGMELAPQPQIDIGDAGEEPPPVHPDDPYDTPDV
jgi:hypothetical protein